MYESFEWDEAKNQENKAKHGVSFEEAQLAFTDTKRIIHKDSGHSLNEDRFFCIGLVRDKIITVRFTFRTNRVRIIGAGHWRRGKKIMSKKINNIEYTDEPIQIGERVPDFLPKPEDLILKNPRRTVTITLDQISIDFFKQKADHHNVPYQRMIGHILQEYVQKMKQK